MATLNSLCVQASYISKNNFPTKTPKNNYAQLFRSCLPNTLSMRDHMSITSSEKINKSSQFLKSNKRFYMYTRSAKQECMAEAIEFKHAILVEHVRELITRATDHVKLDDIFMVDAIYRARLDYLFKDEIKSIVERRHLQFIRKDFFEKLNLYEVSLCFRILRQSGIHVSTDVFKQFKGQDNKFEEKHKEDIRGLMEIYEASQLRIEGENILDEAAKFSRQLLEETIASLVDDESRMIRNTIEHPQRKSLTSFSVTSYSNKLLQELAELEYKMVEPIHTMELNQISRWWNEVGLVKDLCHARNQTQKWYTWTRVTLPDPTFSQQRVDITKIVSLIFVIDDIFDVYGTLSELTLFTDAVNRWDIKVIEELPYYMRSSFKVLYEITHEIADKVCQKHGFNPIDSLRSSWAKLCEAFLVEAKWFASGHNPTTDEYLKNGIVSSGVQVFLVHLFFLLGDGSTEEKARIINDNQGIVISVSKILRLSDDLQCALQDENQCGHDGSFVKCLLEEDDNISLEVATESVIEMISSTWKCLNKECLSGNPFSEAFTKGSINVARLVPLAYSYSDNSYLPLPREIS